ncbi:MAG: UDP-glucose 4-epimerase GalE [Bacteroidetes bacterium]|nr:UDP-glucose 4-epimerase GalE [Bacteroidota bacterium]
MKKSNILVTGGLGFIGSHTVVELIEDGYIPVIVDNLNNSELSVLTGIEKITKIKPIFYNLNILNTNILEEIIIQHQIDCVIHFAAHKAVGESVENPLEYYYNNVSGLISLLKAMEKCNVKKIIFSSSCTVYGQASQLPVTENNPILKAESPYGNTKKICEEILTDVAKTGKLKVVSLRYFNPAGAHKSAFIGELPKGIPNNLIPFITQTAAGIRHSLTIFGDDYNTLDGTCIRDYIHVTDLAKAHVKSINFINSNESEIEVFNIGTGKGSTVLEIVKAFEKENSIKLNYKIGNRRSGDIEKIWADCKKANTLLNWKAQLTIENIVKDAWKWQNQLI